MQTTTPKIRNSPGQEVKRYVKYLFFFTLVSGFLVPYIPESFKFEVLRGGVIFLFLIYFFIRKHQYDFICKIILIFAIYILLMTLVTYLKYGEYSTVSLKILISSLFYLVGYNYIKTREQLLNLSKLYFYSLLLIIAIIIIFNILGIKPINLYYGMKSIYLGSQGVNTTKMFPFLIFPSILYYLYSRNSKKSLFIIIIITTSIIIMLIAQKRGTILAFGFGILTYMLIFPKKNISAKILTYALFLGMITAPLYYDIVMKTWEVRKQRYSVLVDPTNAALHKEERYLEVQRTLNDYLNRSALEILTGTGFKSEFYRYDTTRMLHTDYMMFLDGTGIIGLFLYLGIYYLIFANIKRYAYSLRKDIFNFTVYAVVASLIVATLFTAISGSSHGIDLRASFLLFTGAAIGTLSQAYKQENLQRSNNSVSGKVIGS